MKHTSDHGTPKPKTEPMMLCLSLMWACPCAGLLPSVLSLNLALQQQRVCESASLLLSLASYLLLSHLPRCLPGQPYSWFKTHSRHHLFLGAPRDAPLPLELALGL